MKNEHAIKTALSLASLSWPHSRAKRLSDHNALHNSRNFLSHAIVLGISLCWHEMRAIFTAKTHVFSICRLWHSPCAILVCTFVKSINTQSALQCTITSVYTYTDEPQQLQSIVGSRRVSITGLLSSHVSFPFG
jgi:hypothetical protein